MVYEKTWALPGYTVTSEKYYLTVQGKMAVTKQVVSGTTTYTYYGTDHLGTVRATATFTSGGVYQGYTLQDYEPYGMEIPPRDTTSMNTHRFTGHERDVLNAAPGSYYANDSMHFRMFGPAFGRFMKPDNINGTPTNPQSWNLFAYVHGNPVGFSDPTGHLAGVAWRGYTWAGGDIAGSMGIHQEANALGGGIGLGMHPLDANPLPAGMADTCLTDTIILPRAYNSTVPHFELTQPNAGVTSGPGAGGGGPWKRATFDPYIASYLQHQVVNMKGEVASSIFKVTENLTAFFWDVEPDGDRFINKGSSRLMREAIGAGLYFSGIGWKWTHLLHVHGPRLVTSDAPFRYWDFSQSMSRFTMQYATGGGVGPNDTTAYRVYSTELGGYHPAMGLVDADRTFYEYVP